MVSLRLQELRVRVCRQHRADAVSVRTLLVSVPSSPTPSLMLSVVLHRLRYGQVEVGLGLTICFRKGFFFFSPDFAIKK